MDSRRAEAALHSIERGPAESMAEAHVQPFAYWYYYYYAGPTSGLLRARRAA